MEKGTQVMIAPWLFPKTRDTIATKTAPARAAAKKAFYTGAIFIAGGMTFIAAEKNFDVTDHIVNFAGQKIEQGVDIMNAKDTSLQQLVGVTPSTRKTSYASTSNDNGDMQVASLQTRALAREESARLSKIMPSAEFHAVGKIVTSDASCPELIMNGVVRDQTSCELGYAMLAKN